MLADIEEEQVWKTRKHQKLNRNPSAKKTESPRKKQRTDSIKLTREEIKYQRFVNGLKKDIQIYLHQRLRETQFDPTGYPNFQSRGKYTRMSNIPRQRSKNTETKRLTIDVQAILTGPSMKTFYSEFIHPRKANPIRVKRSRPIEESILWSNEQE